MYRIINHNRKKCSFIVILSIVLFSFFGLNFEVVHDKNADAPLNQYYIDAQITSVNEFVCSEEALQSATRTVLQRQVKLQKKSAGCNAGCLFYSSEMPTFYRRFKSILGLHYFISNCSHRFVIRFIHNKDGQKA